MLTADKQPVQSPTMGECAHFIRTALHQCMLEHNECANYQLAHTLVSLGAPNFVPRRLLHIARRSKADRPSLYDATSSGVSSNGFNIQYAALSHCWGVTSVIQTTVATLSTYSADGIEWESLPKTFQEAISLARELDIDYIWIDSLCEFHGTHVTYPQALIDLLSRHRARLRERLG